MGKKVKKSKNNFMVLLHTASCNHQPRMRHCMSCLM